MVAPPPSGGANCALETRDVTQPMTVPERPPPPDGLAPSTSPSRPPLPGALHRQLFFPAGGGAATLPIGDAEGTAASCAPSASWSAQEQT